MTTTLPTPSTDVDPQVHSEVYDDFTAPGGYGLAQYTSKWANPFGPGETAFADTRTFDDAAFHIAATAFRGASDESVFDHLKYMAVSTRTFPVPVTGSVQFDATITAVTSGTEAGREVHGTYRATGAPYVAATLEGQQAGAVMNIIDFSTGQLFDWFVSGHTAFALIERLPSNVTGNATDPQSPEWVGRDRMYTQIVTELPVGGGPHAVSIRFSRDAATGAADWFFDGELVAHVDHVGVPLDRQGRAPYAGTYPSLGPGEELAPKIDSVSIAHGLFSMVDAFPFQHPEAPELAVTIPLEERRWGQGVSATFADVRVQTVVA